MNFLSINELTSQQIHDIYRLADKLRMKNDRNLLAGKTFILFFPESSLRTRITFEKGIKELGGECVLFPPETLDKRERVSDVMSYLENWADGVIVRHPDESKIRELSSQASIPVINAMTSDNHPCEILSDLYTISRLRGSYKELVYTFVGPAGNICKSWIDIASVMNLRLNHVCTSSHKWGIDNPNYNFQTELDPILAATDVVLTDSLPTEFRTDEYINKYQITLERMKLTKKNAMLNPCPPFIRGEEISEGAISSDYFVGYSFKMNLLYVQQAIVLYCLSH